MLHTHLWPNTATINAHDHLSIGGCDVVELAQTYGTPLYLLDEDTFRSNCRSYRAALQRAYPGENAVHYAGKALLNTAVAQLVADEGLGLDVVSGGELFVALRAGVPAARIHLHGNAKTRAELEQALDAGVGKIVVDTLDELALLAQLSAGRSQPQSILLRIAPDIEAHTHAHIETGRATSKFGLPLDALDGALQRLADAPGLRLVGLHCHLGSQIFESAPFTQAIGVLLDQAARIASRYGVPIGEICPGGGPGVPYIASQPQPDQNAYAQALSAALVQGCQARNLPLPRLMIEPGRSIVARAGVALYTVISAKQLPAGPADTASHYLHIDGGMGDNIRPALYGAQYTALIASHAAAAPQDIVHISGRYCESGDVMLRDLAIPAAGPGDLLAVAVAGAYTLSMANNYNLTQRPALVLVGDGQARLIQRRETYADLVARDQPLDLVRPTS